MATSEETKIEEKLKRNKNKKEYFQVMEFPPGYIWDPSTRLKEEKQPYIEDYRDIGMGNGMKKEVAENLADRIFEEFCAEVVMESIRKESMYGEYWPEEVWLDINERIHHQDKKAKREMRKFRYYCVECNGWVKKLFVCKGCGEGSRICSKHCQKKVWNRAHRFVCDKRFVCEC